MFLIKNKINIYLYFFFLLFILVFIKFSTTIVYADNYTVKNIKIKVDEFAEEKEVDINLLNQAYYNFQKNFYKPDDTLKRIEKDRNKLDPDFYKVLGTSLQKKFKIFWLTMSNLGYTSNS